MVRIGTFTFSTFLGPTGIFFVYFVVNYGFWIIRLTAAGYGQGCASHFSSSTAKAPLSMVWCNH